MNKLTIAMCLALVAVIAAPALAKRAGPKPVAPVVHQGVKYVAPNASGLEGKVEAWDERTGKKMWEAVIYTVKPDPNLQQDVQWVFITALAIQDGNQKTGTDTNGP